MFDAFEHQILWEELGRLDPNWFEELTAKASRGEWSDTEQEHVSTAILCGEDGSFKTPLEKCTLDSNMSSTPKIFRCRTLRSPESLIDEKCFSPDQGARGRDTCPCLFGISVDSEFPSKHCRTTQCGDLFGLLATPKHMPEHSAKRISESLGAQLNPDVSWTSSLNTPVMSPTIILTKTDEQRHMCPVGPSAEDHVMFVRKLFPSLSKTFESKIPYSEQNRTPASQHNDTSPGDNSGHWKQTLPDAIEDQNIHSTVASVLDGADLVRSIFFCNSNLDLRKVKAKERIKRKQICTTRLNSIKEYVSTYNMEHDGVFCERTEDNSETSESRINHKSGDLGISQCTPISVFDIPDSDIDTCHQDGSSTKYIVAQGGVSDTFPDSPGSQQLGPSSCKQTLQLDTVLHRNGLPDFSLLEGSQLKHSVVKRSLKQTFTQKTTTFVSSVKSQLPSTTVFQSLLASPATEHSGKNQNTKQKEAIPNKTEFSNLNKTALHGKSLQLLQDNETVSQAPAKDPDIDMSQLCWAFAQDFSQAVDFCKPCTKKTEAIQNGFFASACLSAAGKTTKELVARVESDTQYLKSGIIDVMHIAASQFSNPLNMSVVFPSSLTDVAQTTHSSHLYPEIGFETCNRIFSLPPEIIQKDKSSIGPTIEEKITTETSELEQTLTFEKGSPLSRERSLISPLDIVHISKQSKLKCNDHNVSVSLQPESGFKTVSKKRISISAANLEKAKDLFKLIEDKNVAGNCLGVGLSQENNVSCGLEFDEECTGTLQLPICTNQRSVNSDSLLTTSQRADVSELCSLLEDADSQFEFTQFKPAKHSNYVPTKLSDKELDPDFLTGIDFDDSFNSDVEKQSVKLVTPDKNTIDSHCKHFSKVVSSNILLPFGLTENHIGHGLRKRAHSIHSYSSKKKAMSSSEINFNSKHLEVGMGFKSASGNAMTLSERGLSKARALFADFEEVNGINSHKCAVTNAEQIEASPFKCKSKIDSSRDNVSCTIHLKDSHDLERKRDLNKPCDKHMDKIIDDLSHCHKRGNHNFQTASGSVGTIPAKAVQNLNADLHPSTIESSDCASEKQKNNCGFSTAGGKPASPLKSQTLLNGSDDSENCKPRSPSLKAYFPPLNIQQGGYFGFKRPSSEAGSMSAKVQLTSKFECERGGKSHDLGGKSQKLDNSETHSKDPLQAGCGFSTASGKIVCVSNGALLKAQAFLSDYVVDLKEASKIQNIPNQNLLQNQSGFKSASGKIVTVSAEAIQQANVFFKDSEEVNIAHVLKNIPEESSCTSAGGKKVHVTENNPSKAESILNKNLDENCTDFERGFTNDSNLPDTSKCKSICDLNTDFYTSLIHEPLAKHDGFKTASGKGVISAVALQQTKGFFKDCDIVTADAKQENSSVNPDVLIHKAMKISCDFITAGGQKVHVSKKGLSKARIILSDKLNQNCQYFEKGFTNNSRLSETSESQSTCDLKTGLHTRLIQDVPHVYGGFKTASGRGVTVSAKAIQKGNTVFNDCNSDMHSIISADAKQGNSYLKSANGTISNLGKSNCALTTAGEKNVHFAELVGSGKKERSILNEYIHNSYTDSIAMDEFWISNKFPILTEDDKMIKQQAENKLDCSDHHSVDKSCVIRTVNQNTVCVSDRALQKANSFLCERKELESAEWEKSIKKDFKIEKQQHNISNFSTAIGKNVSISEILFQHDVFQHKSAHSPGVTGNNPVGSTSCFSTASGKQVSVSENALQEANARFNECADDIIASYTDPQKSAKDKRQLKVPTPHIQSLQMLVKAAHMDDCEVIQTCVKPACLPSILEPLGITDCSVTKQSYFAQEAMDCTKDLLQDKDLADQSIEPPKQDNPKSFMAAFELRSGIRKRLAEDVRIRDQPPLKRILLEEFDRTLDCNRSSRLTPAKSSLDGTFKDRRLFRYNVALQPNVTRPQCTKQQKMILDPTMEDIKPANSKSALFVPPFQKKVKAEKHSISAPQDKAKAPGVFVPPFRKDNRVTSEAFAKPSEENICSLVSKTLSKIDTSLLPKYNHMPVTDTSCNKDNGSLHELDPQCLKTTEAGNEWQSHLVGQGVESGIEAEHTACHPATNFTDVKLDKACLELSRDLQDMRIRKKKRQIIRPLPGSLYLAKTSGATRQSLRKVVCGRHPVQHTVEQLYGYGVHRYVAEISSENSEAFRFVCKNFFRNDAFIDGRIQLGDGGWLIPNDDGTAGKYEFYRALCDSPGVDPKLISEAWVFNHYRWVVWKQACMERAFPQVMGSLCLTPEQVLLQLKYRYDVEVDKCMRSALRKIVEKDDTAAKTMVLCVCGIVTKGHNPTGRRWNETKTPQSVADSKEESTPVGVIWLTDGWYAIKALLDVPLTAMLHRGRLGIGGKLLVHGAELVGSQDACSPLEAPDTLMLKIRANSTRVALWDTRLGFYKNPRPFLLPLSSLYGNGGPVGCVDIVVLRSYPTQWMEKKLDGGVVFRSQRAEEKEQQRHENAEIQAREILFAKIQSQIEKEEDDCNKPKCGKRTLRDGDIERLVDGEALFDAVENDPVYLEACLSEQQREALNKYRQCVGERRQAVLQERIRQVMESEGYPQRNVSSVWKLCVADSRTQAGSNVYMLNIWSPSQDIQSLLNEGCRYRAYQLSTLEGKKRPGNASVQFTATKKTHFQKTQASTEWFCERFQAREAVGFHVLLNPDFQPLCGEVDLVGYVISITDRQGNSPVVYLVDGRLDFVKVHCFSSLAQQGMEELIKPLTLLALSNLKLGAQPSFPCGSSIPSLYAGDLVMFSTNPKELHLQEAATQLRNLVQGQKQFFRTAEEKLSTLVQGSLPTLAPLPRTPGLKADAKQDTNITPQQVPRSIGPSAPLNWSIPYPPTCSSGGDTRDPKRLKRKRGLDYLCRIPLHSARGHHDLPSPRVNKTFNPPRRAETPNVIKAPASRTIFQPLEDEWVDDEELAMIDTQALHDGVGVYT
ncbi:hypothetical protein UPYG_G00206250 [Umbra pygmaea]|uniref:Tower domain-containing protein n=1 Tax=Umbra pygmaea TaxID=75934 RepID=A0ABD0WJ49_UMBPY